MLQEVERSESLDKNRLLAALVALRRGDFSVRLPLDGVGIEGKIADVFNEVIELNERMARELERMSRVVGKEGRIAERGLEALVSAGPDGRFGTADDVASFERDR